VGVPGVEGCGTDGRAGLLLAGVHHVLAVRADGAREAIHATRGGTCPLLAQAGALAAVAEALEPAALVAQRRELAAEMGTGAAEELEREEAHPHADHAAHERAAAHLAGRLAGDRPVGKVGAHWPSLTG